MYLPCIPSRVSTSIASHHHTNIAHLGFEPLVRVLLKVASSTFATLRSVLDLDGTRGSAWLGLFSQHRVPSVTLYIHCISLHNIASHCILIALLLPVVITPTPAFHFPGHCVLRKLNPWITHCLKWYLQHFAASLQLANSR